MRTLTRTPFLILPCFLVALGPLNLLQVIAWANMLHSYSDGRSLTEAADMTFSGDFPCEMCQHIAEARSLPENQPVAPFPSDDRPTLRLDCLSESNPTPTPPRWLASTHLQGGPIFNLVSSSLSAQVPTPPPQLA